MPAEKIIKEEENNNLTSSEENIQEEKDIEQFLQQIDNIVNVSPKTNTQQKQSDVEKIQIFLQTKIVQIIVVQIQIVN